MRARLARLEAVYAIKLGGVEYIFVKAAWLQKPTKAKIAMYNRMNSIVGPDSVTGCFFCEDPENPDTVFDTKEPFMLADQIASREQESKQEPRLPCNVRRCKTCQNRGVLVTYTT